MRNAHRASNVIGGIPSWDLPIIKQKQIQKWTEAEF